MQHDTVQATGLALATAPRRAHEAATVAERQTAQRREELGIWWQQHCPQSAHLAELQQQIEQAVATEAAGRQQLAACQQRQQQPTEALRAVARLPSD